MAWNEPGKGKDKDPWGGGNRNTGGGGDGGGPPDLEQLWRRFRDRFFNRGNGNGGGESPSGGGGPSGAVIIALVVVAALIWLATGMYVVQPGEKGVLLRFGAYTHTAGSGWHWHLPYPIEEVDKVDTQQVRKASHRAVMLTKNENFVDIEVSVQYRISNAMNFLFQLQDPEATVNQVLRSAVRDVVGTSRMNQVIQEGVSVGDLNEKGIEHVNLKKNAKSSKSRDALSGINHELVGKIKKKQKNAPQIGNRSRAQLPNNIHKIMQVKLSDYQAGIKIVAVNVQYAQPPEPVQHAFEEAIKAREEKEQKKNMARADARHILASVQGQKAKIVAKARGYKQREIERAKGDASRFTQLLAQYQKVPDVTRERLYLKTMGDVLSNSHVILNNTGSSSMMYMPLQKILNGSHQQKQSEKKASNGAEDNDNTGLPMLPKQSSHGGSDSDNHESSSRSRSRNS